MTYEEINVMNGFMQIWTVMAAIGAVLSLLMYKGKLDFIDEWARDMMVAARKAITMEEEALISHREIFPWENQFYGWTEEEIVEYGARELAYKHNVPMI